MKEKHSFFRKRISFRIISISTMAVILLFALAACGGAAKSSPASYPAVERNAVNAPEAAQAGGGLHGTQAGSETADTSAQEAPLLQDGRKIILNANLEVETLTFGDTCAAIRRMVTQSGGYFAASDTSVSYGGQQASFTAMVPSEKYNGFLTQLEGNATITRRSESSQDITAEYVDIEARLSALKVQETRLTELMAQAKSLEDLITIQDRLTEVQYEIEKFSGAQRTYDQLVAYSTVDIFVREVREITPPEPESYWDRAGRALAETWDGVVRFFQNAGIMLIFSLPLVVVVVVVALIVLIATRKRRKNRRKNNPASPAPLATGVPPTPAPGLPAQSPGNPAETGETQSKQQNGTK